MLRSRSPEAERARRYRGRQRRGIRVYAVPVIEFATLSRLIDGGYISEADSRDPGKVAQALARILAGWASGERFRHP